MSRFFRPNNNSKKNSKSKPEKLSKEDIKNARKIRKELDKKLARGESLTEEEWEWYDMVDRLE